MTATTTTFRELGRTIPPLPGAFGYGRGMDGESQLWVLEGWQLWAVGIIAMLVVGAAFVWVMRHLGDASLPEHPEYLAPKSP